MPNPEGRIIKNWNAELKIQEGQTGMPNLTIRPKIQLV